MPAERCHPGVGASPVRDGTPEDPALLTVPSFRGAVLPVEPGEEQFLPGTNMVTWSSPVWSVEDHWSSCRGQDVHFHVNVSSRECSPDTGVPFGITQGRRLGPEPEPAPEPPVAVQAELSELSELEIEAVRFGAVTSCEEKQK